MRSRSLASHGRTREARQAMSPITFFTRPCSAGKLYTMPAEPGASRVEGKPFRVVAVPPDPQRRPRERGIMTTGAATEPAPAPTNSDERCEERLHPQR